MLRLNSHFLGFLGLTLVYVWVFAFSSIGLTPTLTRRGGGPLICHFIRPIGRAPPPPRTLPAVARAAAAEAQATRAERAAAALAAERKGLARARQDVVRRRRQVRLD